MPSQALVNGLKGLVAFVVITGVGIAFLQHQYNSSPSGQAELAKQAQADTDRPLINVAETLVKARLRNPESAAFTGTKVVRSGNKEAVCGFVNAQNGMGGLSGDKWFIVVDGAAYFMNDGADAAQAIETTCGTAT